MAKQIVKRGSVILVRYPFTNIPASIGGYQWRNE
jgi:hypothetical protein